MQHNRCIKQAFFYWRKLNMNNEITLIVGKLKSGKTTLSDYALQQYQKAVIITTFGGDFHNCDIVQSGELEQAVEDRIEKICFVSDNLTENEIAIRYAYELGNRLLIIDEAHLYQDSESFKKVMRYSRHKNLDVILISHTLFDFARLNRVLVNNILTAKMNEPYELSYLNRINDSIAYDKLGQYEFAIAQGDIPQWLDKKDLTFKEKILMLKKEALSK